MKRILAIFFLVIVLGVSGCTQSSPGVTTPSHTVTVTTSPGVPQRSIVTPNPTTISLPEVEQTSVSDNTVLIKKNAFDPQVVTVKKGATVRWENSDDSAHRIRFADGYTAQLLSPGQSWSKIFTNPGLFDYTDLVNPSLHGTVKVE
jgi:plastocyanin